MKAFKAIVKKNLNNAAIHYVTVDDEALGRVKFHFSRIGFNIKSDDNYPIDRMLPATFKQQLRSFNRAYAVTICDEDEYIEFIEAMMKKAYGNDWGIRVEVMDENISEL